MRDSPLLAPAFTIFLSRQKSGAKARAPKPTPLWNYSRTWAKPITRSAFATTGSIAITSARCASLRRRNKLLPNDSSVPWDIAAIKRRQGQWREAVDNYRQILTLDPQNANVVRDLLYIYCAMRDWPDCPGDGGNGSSRSRPDSINAKAQIGYVEFWAKGSTARLKSEMASVPRRQRS